MAQPLGIADPMFPHQVCKLQRVLYDLKQAPCIWFDCLSAFLLQHGFFCSLVGASLFILHSTNGILIHLLYVDDMLLTGFTS